MSELKIITKKKFKSLCSRTFYWEVNVRDGVKRTQMSTSKKSLFCEPPLTEVNFKICPPLPQKQC